jgi:hypothetical protein
LPRNKDKKKKGDAQHDPEAEHNVDEAFMMLLDELNGIAASIPCRQASPTTCRVAAAGAGDSRRGRCNLWR